MTALSDGQLASVGMNSDVVLGFRQTMKANPSCPRDAIPVPDHFWEPRNAPRLADFERGAEIARTWRTLRTGTGIARRESRNRQFRESGMADAIDHAAVRDEAWSYLLQAVAHADGFGLPDPILVQHIVARLHDREERQWPLDAVLFHDHDAENGILSNTHPAILRASATRWTSGEAVYQSQKHPELEIREAIRLAPDALEAKRLSREAIGRVPPTVRNRWRATKVTAMARVVVLRLQQDLAYRDAVSALSGRVAVEASPDDRFWGAVRTDDALVGANVLGRMLTIAAPMILHGAIPLRQYDSAGRLL